MQGPHRHGEGVNYDGIASAALPPRIANGSYQHASGEQLVCSQLQGLQANPEQYQLTDLGLVVVGNKVESCNIILTILSCLFMPGVFCVLMMCSNSFKRFLYFKYQIHTDTYRTIAATLKAHQNIKHVRITILDNNFNAEKAAILCEAVQQNQLTTFRLHNKAANFDYRDTEYTDFEANMRHLHATNTAFEVKWSSSSMNRGL